MFGPEYNLVVFDPRGVENSGPNLDCFPDDPESRAIFETQFFRLVSDESDQSVAQQYVNTLAVATDILRYAEQQATINGVNASEAKVYYYGISYGTVIGQTFASMYPDRIGRMILDGIADSEDYSSGAWKSAYVQMDDAISSFDFCFEAGPQHCLFAGNSSSVAALETRFDAIVTRLKDNPIPISNPSISSYPILATYTDLKRYMFSAVYSALVFYPFLSQVLTDLENRNGTSLAQVASYTHVDTTARTPRYDATIASIAIHCIDAANRTFYPSVEAYKQYVDFLERQSPITFSAQGFYGSACQSLDVIPPASSFVPIITASANHTSCPILIATNKLDPVCPNIAAHRVGDAGFLGSVVLTQDAVGHGTPSSVSERTYGIFNRYLTEEALPATNTSCKADLLVFRDSGVGTFIIGLMVRVEPYVWCS